MAPLEDYSCSDAHMEHVLKTQGFVVLPQLIARMDAWEGSMRDDGRVHREMQNELVQQLLASVATATGWTPSLAKY